MPWTSPLPFPPSKLPTSSDSTSNTPVAPPPCLCLASWAESPGRIPLLGLRLQRAPVIAYGQAAGAASPAPEVSAEVSHPCSHHRGKAQVLTCDVKGFYPEAIAVNWLLNGVRTEAPGVNPNGTFNLESFYQFKPAAELEGAEISCEVQHETLSRPIVRSVRVHLERE
uniref:Ig-like domain-containing protein n=1 Tax=Chrysemys picta bellii TaxID=8478 RepID=A0A8C3F8E2_CHRPI